MNRQLIAPIVIVLWSASGCDEDVSPATRATSHAVAVPTASNETPPPAPEPVLNQLPVEFTVRQRTTSDVPGAKGEIRVTIDDITRGQVMVSVAGAEGEVLLAESSLTTGDSAEFELRGQTYVLLLKELNNALVGEDFATFEISAAGDPSNDEPEELTESQKIDALIEHIGSMKNSVFIRNGSEHPAGEAAEHLRRKWNSAANEITTAEAFIEQIASRSSLTGEPYQIRFSDGSVVQAETYLREQLAKLDGKADAR